MAISEELLYIHSFCTSQGNICCILKFLIARMESNVSEDVNIINNSNNVVVTTNPYFVLILCQALLLVFSVTDLTQTSQPFCEVDAGTVPSPVDDRAKV